MADDNTRAHHPPPWLFGLTGVPYGIGGGFVATTMPYFARKAHFSMSEIGWYGTALLFPPIVQFLYAPIVDVGPKRKCWLVIVTAHRRALLRPGAHDAAAVEDHAFLVLAFVGQAISGLSGSCNGGLMATTMPGPPARRRRWLAQRRQPHRRRDRRLADAGDGRALSADRRRWRRSWLLMTLPSLAVLWIHEPDRARRAMREVFSTLWNDVTHVVRARQGWTGMLLFASPVGTAALLNYFAGMAPDYRATDGDGRVRQRAGQRSRHRRRLAHRRLPVRSLQPPRACTSCRAR